MKIESDRSIDIDTVDDFYKMRQYFKQKNNCFHVIGRNDIGLGHVYRALTIANELIGNDIIFVVNIKDDLAIKLIKKNNYKLKLYKNNNSIKLLIHVTLT